MTSTHPDPVRLLETLLALGVQLLIADNPELLLPPEVPILHPTRRLLLARNAVALIRETHYALERYCDAGPYPSPTTETASANQDDAIPF
jgi:hypothetical protein